MSAAQLRFSRDKVSDIIFNDVVSARQVRGTSTEKPLRQDDGVGLLGREDELHTCARRPFFDIIMPPPTALASRQLAPIFG